MTVKALSKAIHDAECSMIAGGTPNRTKVHREFDDEVAERMQAELLDAGFAVTPTGLDWLSIFDRATGGDGNGSHGQDRFGFNTRVDEILRA